jgi:hypothetical protein
MEALVSRFEYRAYSLYKSASVQRSTFGRPFLRDQNAASGSISLYWVATNHCIQQSWLNLAQESSLCTLESR